MKGGLGSLYIFKLKYMTMYLKLDISTTRTNVSIKIEPIFAINSGENLFNLVNEEYVPNDNDKLFFLPGVSLPRIKLKDLSLKHKIKTVQNIQEATHVFASTSTKAKIMHGEWFYEVPTTDVQDLYDKYNHLLDDKVAEDLKTALSFYQEPVFFLQYGDVAAINNGPSFLKGCLVPSSNSSVKYVLDTEHNSMYPYLSHVKILNVNTLISQINGSDAITIDETMFRQLSEMFESTDQDNHIIAMEIMANCNYLSSILYLEFLFYEYANKMYDCRTKNHVNFKSLVSYLNKTSGYYTTMDNIMASLIDKDCLTEEKLNIIMQHYDKHIAEDGGNDYFEVKSLTLTQKTAKVMNINYVHTLVSDFTPEIVEEPVIVEETVEIEEETEEIKTEEEVVHELYGVDNDNIEVSLTSKPESNNDQTETKNDNDFEWF